MIVGGNAPIAWLYGLDDRPTWVRLVAYALQHVLVLYAGTVAVPLILGTAAHLAPREIATLICASLGTSGIATLIQVVGIGNIGCRLPAIQATSFVCLGPIVAISDRYGMTSAFGAVIASGIMLALFAPLAALIISLFQPVVVACVVTSIGLTLVPVSIGWMTASLGGLSQNTSIAIACATVILILCLQSVLPSRLRALSILGGIAAMTCVMGWFGTVDWRAYAASNWFGWPTPLHFGMPRFQLAPIVVVSLTMLVTLVETAGNCSVLTDALGLPLEKRRLDSAFRADGVATAIGGIFCGLPYTTFSQNTGLVLLTRIASLSVSTAVGMILVALGACPKIGALVSCVPLPILGGASLFMFGMVTAAGIRQFAHVDLRTDANLVTIAVGLSVSLIPVAAPHLFDGIPLPFQLFGRNGTVLCCLTCLFAQFVLGRRTADGR